MQKKKFKTGDVLKTLLLIFPMKQN